jgi:putative transposase
MSNDQNLWMVLGGVTCRGAPSRGGSIAHSKSDHVPALPRRPRSLAHDLIELAVALQAEVSAYIDAHAEEVGENGHRLVVRNGHHNEREVITAAGPVPVRAPRVNDKRTDPATGERKRFASAILPAWARKSPRVAEVLPLLYLHGLSSSDFGPALTQFLGTGHGLSAATITRLTKDWQDEARTFNKRSLAGTDYVYCWVDGIHLKVRLEQDKVCLLVMIGVRRGRHQGTHRA